MKELSADEMFNELGYEKIHDNRKHIVYKRKWLAPIEFIHREKWVNAYFNLDMQELQAINAKVKELGWEV